MLQGVSELNMCLDIDTKWQTCGDKSVFACAKVYVFVHSRESDSCVMRGESHKRVPFNQLYVKRLIEYKCDTGTLEW